LSALRAEVQLYHRLSRTAPQIVRVKKVKKTTAQVFYTVFTVAWKVTTEKNN